MNLDKHLFLLCQKQTFRGPYKLNNQLCQNLIKRKINIDSILRWISIQWISVGRMTHFAGEYFLFNLHLKRMKFGLFVKPHVSNNRLIIEKCWKLKTFLISEAATREVFFRKSCSWKIHRFHRKTPMLESLFDKVADFSSCAILLKSDSNSGFFLWNLWSF